jgi:hypothetical protein
LKVSTFYETIKKSSQKKTPVTRFILRVEDAAGAHRDSLRSNKPMRFFRLNPRCSARVKGVKPNQKKYTPCSLNPTAKNSFSGDAGISC